MMTIRHAAFRRILDRGSGRYAEVEVETDHSRSPHLLAYFRSEGGGRYQLVRVIANDADTEADWFDNSLHSAYEDVTTRMFAGPNHGAAEDRVEFGRRLVEYGDIREQLDRHLKGVPPNGR
ncbi:hypothetical protein J19TS2_21060 [Cohnella xylanilytica]|uniref:Uncharacterized protein n=1 Tax=Cohnella xylanilytica TaxID=557555 RepID=A0A841TZN7_9BACL|nr:hypothetical protein [Cohnella xylanilytica]MBB6692418.1 hypothetical protein [Cohnella xylanilytica]GIO12551.1 hypothetical protein J19TS2_21060 [Cohnella xylanilytica]